MSYKPPKGSKGHKALGHIYRASVYAYGGHHNDAETHVKSAHEHVSEHVKELTNSGKHTEAEYFNTEAQRLLGKLDGIMKRTKKYYKKSEIANEASDLEKVDITKPYKNAEEAKSTGMRVNASPGYNEKFDYKAFHQLSPEDQKKALHAFGEKDMTSHLYPHDKKSGELIHGQRWKAPSGRIAAMKPKASQGFTAVDPVRPQLSPQHRSGAAVRIHAEGHEMHGRFGVVQMPNPNTPNKITVRMDNNGRFENHHFDADQVKLSGDMKKSEEESHQDLISRAKNVLSFFRKKKE